MGKVYEQALRFKERHPMTIAWRLKQNASVIEKHLNPGEIPLYSFAAQKNDSPFNIWGKVYIDTMKEFITLSNISKKALVEIETEVSSYMLEEKKKYINQDNNSY